MHFMKDVNLYCYRIFLGEEKEREGKKEREREREHELRWGHKVWGGGSIEERDKKREGWERLCVCVWTRIN